MTSKHLLALAAFGAGLFFAMPSQAYDGHLVDVHVGIPAPVTVVQHDHHDASCGCPDYGYRQTYAPSHHRHAPTQYGAPHHVDSHGRGHRDVRVIHGQRYDQRGTAHGVHDNKGRTGKHQGDRRGNGHGRHR